MKKNNIDKEKEELYLKKLKNCQENYDWLMEKILKKTPFNKVKNEIKKHEIIRVYRKCYEKNETNSKKIINLFESFNKLFEFYTNFPVYKKNKIPTLNNVNEWYKWYNTKLKNTFKDNLKDFCIPITNKKYESLIIKFEIHRNTLRILDSDAIGFIIKWVIDAIKEKEWLIDDDQIYYFVVPSQLDRSLKENQLKITVYEP